jgi:hypothetical protein
MPADRARSCDRPVCEGPATASLTYDYAGRRAWLDDLDDDHDPHAYDLCTEHADRLTVPRGWACDDRRSAVRPLFHVQAAGPSGRHRADVAV